VISDHHPNSDYEPADMGDLDGGFVLITVRYPSEQTRRSVISAYQSGQTIGWVFSGNGWFRYLAGGTPELANRTDVRTMLEAIGGDALMVMGSTGISATQSITTSTIGGMESDDYVVLQIMGRLPVADVWTNGSISVALVVPPARSCF
jgi:hypothetical protein